MFFPKINIILTTQLDLNFPFISRYLNQAPTKRQQQNRAMFVNMAQYI